MSGIVGVLANDSARFSLFSACMDRLRLPDGWRKEWLIGGDWCGARNTLCQMTLDDGEDWLWFMDDDHAFPPDLLQRLLRHDLHLVMPVCLTRSAPFAPVTFTDRLDGDENGGRYLPAYLPDQGNDDVIELVAGGTAGMLIHRTVLEAVEPPWFEYGFASEDILFCEKAREKGFHLNCDLSARLGHITTAVVWPHYDEENDWTVGVEVGSVGQTTRVLLPIEQREIV